MKIELRERISRDNTEDSIDDIEEKLKIKLEKLSRCEDIGSKEFLLLDERIHFLITLLPEDKRQQYTAEREEIFLKFSKRFEVAKEQARSRDFYERHIHNRHPKGFGFLAEITYHFRRP